MVRACPSASGLVMWQESDEQPYQASSALYQIEPIASLDKFV